MTTVSPLEALRHYVSETEGAFSPSLAAEATGIAPGTVRNFLRRMLDKGEIEQRGYGRYRRVARGDGAVAEASVAYASPPPPIAAPDHVEIVLHASRVSAGAGIATYLENEEQVFTLHRWIVTEILGIRHPPRRIGAAVVAGDCMEPDLMDGDVVFFDYDSGFRGAGRYVLWLHDGPNVKRLSTLADGSYRIACDNKSCGYVDEILTPNADDALIHRETGRAVELRIVGAVIWPRRSATQSLMAQIRSFLATGHAEILRGSQD